MSRRLWRARAVTGWRQNASCPPRTPLLGEKRSSIFKSVLCSVLSSKINDSTCVRLCFDLRVCVCLHGENEREYYARAPHFYQQGGTRTNGFQDGSMSLRIESTGGKQMLVEEQKFKRGRMKMGSRRSHAGEAIGDTGVIEMGLRRQGGIEYGRQ